MPPPGGGHGSGAGVRGRPGAALAIWLVFASTSAPLSVPAATPSMTVEPNVVAPGDPTTVTGKDFVAGTTLQLYLDEIGRRTFLADTRADRRGTFTASVTIPSSTTPGQHRILGCEPEGGTCRVRAQATVNVRRESTPIPTPTTPPGSTVPTATPTAGSTPPPATASPTAPASPSPSAPGPGLKSNETAPDVYVKAIEVTQGIQDMKNHMPLLPLRPTFARVYVGVKESQVFSTRGILGGFRDGKLLGTVTALNQPIGLHPAASLPRWHPDSALLFRIPAGWTVGKKLTLAAFVYDTNLTTAFDLEPDVDNNLRSTTVAFHDTAVLLRMVLAPIHLHEGSDAQGDDITFDPFEKALTLGRVLSGLERLLPVSLILPLPLPFLVTPAFHGRGVEWDIDETEESESGNAFGPLNMMEIVRDGSGDLLSTYFWYGLLPATSVNFWSDAGEAIPYGGLSNGELSMGQMSTGGSTPFEVSGSSTMAHELGHDLGLGHYACLGPTGDRRFPTEEHKGGGVEPEFPTPYPNCRFAFVDPQGFYGLDVHYDRFGLNQPSVIHNDLTLHNGEHAWPLMSYGEDKWADPYSYCRMLEAFDVTCNAYPPPDAGVPGPDQIQQGSRISPVRVDTVQPTGATLLVSGFASEAGDGGGLFEVGLLDDAPPATLQRSAERRAAVSSTSPVVLVLQDASGAELARHPLARRGLQPDEGSSAGFGFVEWVPAPDGLNRVTLLGAGRVLAEARASAARPAVEMVAPTAGANLAGTFVLQWRGSDPDGDTLQYDVMTSGDGGKTWRIVARRLGETSLTMSTNQLPRSRRTRLRVRAWDGFNTAHAETGDLAVSNSPPALVLITGPDDGAVYRVSDLVVLSGRASDLEDGMARDLVWSSDRDGRLGTGPEVGIRSLTAGEHVITLRATDRDGASREATVRVVIDGTRVADVPDAATVGRVERLMVERFGAGRSWYWIAILGGAVILGAASILRMRRRRAARRPMLS